MTDVALARREPELAVLSVMAHGRGEPETARAVANAARAAAQDAPEEQRMLYLALIEIALGDAARKAFDMHPLNEKIVAEAQRRYYERGRAAGVLAVLEARGLAVTDAQRERLLDCTDAEQIDRWLRQAATAVSIDKLFE